MSKTVLQILLVSSLLIAAQACSVPGASAPDQNAVNTAVAQTMSALTQTAQPGIPVTGPSATPTRTVPPTVVLSQTPLFTSTPAVLVPQVSVSLATNCRLGPGAAYTRVSALLVGQAAAVVGRSADGNYWIIRNPDRPNQLCWLWGQYAILTGNTTNLPVYTPPPAPTPSRTPVPAPTPSAIPTSRPEFTASYRGIESCTDTGWWLDIELKNTGGVTFQSMAMNVTDAATATALPLYADSFMNKNGCAESDTRANLPAGGILTVSSPVFNYDPTGHELRAVITLCSDPGQSGTCTTQSIDFTP